MAPKSRVMILKEYFGLKQGQSLMDFARELKDLNENEKIDLARLAAKELGYEEPVS